MNSKIDLVTSESLKANNNVKENTPKAKREYFFFKLEGLREKENKIQRNT